MERIIYNNMINGIAEAKNMVNKAMLNIKNTILILFSRQLVFSNFKANISIGATINRDVITQTNVRNKIFCDKNKRASEL